MTPKEKFDALGNYDKEIATYFADKEKYFLFALALDYPGLKRIPLCYLDKTREELRSLDLRNHPKKYDTPGFRIFYYGPRPLRSSCTTRRSDANAFKVYFYNFYNRIKEENAR